MDKVQHLTVMLKIDVQEDGQEYYRWRLEDAHGKPLQRGGGDLQQLSQVIADCDCQVWLLLPGSRVLVRSLEITRKEARHLHSLIPYQLEDELAVDTDEMHFVYGFPTYGSDVTDKDCSDKDSSDKDERSSVTVLAVEKIWLQYHLDKLAEMHIDVNFCVVEPLCLPETDDGWTLRLNDELLVRTGDQQGFSVHLSVAAKALELASQEQSEPKVITLLADSESQLQRLMQLLPKSLRSRVDSVRSGHEWEFSRDPDRQINLLQSSFARRLPFKRWWSLWRFQVGMAAAAVLLVSGVMVTEHYLLQQEQQQLHQKIAVTYREFMPEGALVDAEKQLQHQVELLSHSERSSQLLSMLSSVFPLIAAQEKIQLKTLSFRDAENSLRINIEAQSFKSIEALRGELEQRGLKAKIISANVSAQQRNQSLVNDDSTRTHQARLQIYFPHYSKA